ncbi:Sybindin-like protein, partial [Rozella allomycis CSF55]
MIYSLYIVNKSGGLSYQRDFNESGHPKLSINDYLVLASTFQSVHAISAQISPVTGSSGIEVLEAETFKLHCHQTPTVGVKFLITTDFNQNNVEFVTKKIYEVYSDFVMKNPFQTLEMPIKCDLFN